MRQFLEPLAILLITALILQLVFSCYVILTNCQDQNRRLHLYGEFDWSKVFVSAFDLSLIMPYAVIFASWAAFHAAETTPSNILYGALSLTLTFLGLKRLR